MANQQQISLSLAFVAAAMILLASQVRAGRELMLQVPGDLKFDPNIVQVKGGLVSDPNLEAYLKEMLGATQRTKDKVLVLGNSQMVKDCDKAYGVSIDYLNKALGLLQSGIKTSQGFQQLEATVSEALKAYDDCDHVFAVSTRPSPFVINNTNLKSLGSKCKQFAEQDAKKN